MKSSKNVPQIKSWTNVPLMKLKENEYETVLVGHLSYL